jgi:hypothetical protein
MFRRRAASVPVRGPSVRPEEFWCMGNPALGKGRPRPPLGRDRRWSAAGNAQGTGHPAPDHRRQDRHSRHQRLRAIRARSPPGQAQASRRDRPCRHAGRRGHQGMGQDRLGAARKTPTRHCRMSRSRITTRSSSPEARSVPISCASTPMPSRSSGTSVDVTLAC